MGFQTHIPPSSSEWCRTQRTEEGVDRLGAEAGIQGPWWRSMLPAATRVDKATFKDLKSKDRGAQHTR